LFLAGVSGAWIGNLTALEPYQPIFAGVSLAFIGFGAWRLRRQAGGRVRGRLLLIACLQPIYGPLYGTMSHRAPELEDQLWPGSGMREVRFAVDSPLEGAGFEPSVPPRRPSPPWRLNLLQL
jgi:hypothetical protein